MVVVSRSEVDHPALATVGGAALHTLIETIYTKLGDNSNARFFQFTAINDATLVETRHNFGVNLDQLNVLVYTGSGDNLTRVVDPTIIATPWTIAEKPTEEKIALNITTPATGQPHTFVIVIIHGKGAEKLTDLSDVDLLSNPPEDGQALVYNQGTTDWRPGASGDSSFKLQSISGNDLIVKAGLIIDNNNREFNLSADTTVNLASITSSDGDYYLYIDTEGLGATTINGRSIFNVFLANFVAFTTLPSNFNTVRYVPLGTFQRAAGPLFSNQQTLAARRHDSPVNFSALEFSQDFQAIGKVGNASDAANFGPLVAGDFPTGTVSFWHLDVDGNDDSANGKNLVDTDGTTSVTFDQKGHFGRTQLASMDVGEDAGLRSTDVFFNPSAGTSFFAGCRFKAGQLAQNFIMGQKGDTSGTDIAWYIETNGGNLDFNVTNDGTTLQTFSVGLGDQYNDRWIHVIISISNGGAMRFFLDGQLIGFANVVGTRHVSTATHFFTIGSSISPNISSSCVFEDAFFVNGATCGILQGREIASKAWSTLQLVGGGDEAYTLIPSDLGGTVYAWEMQETASGSLTNVSGGVDVPLGPGSPASSQSYDILGRLFFISGAASSWWSVAIATLPAPTADFSACIWVNAAANDEFGLMAHHTAGEGGGDGVWFVRKKNSVGNAGWFVEAVVEQDNPTAQLGVNSTDIPHHAGWVHVAVTWDNSTKFLSIYLNGEFSARGQGAGHPHVSTVADFQIGNAVFQNSTTAYQGLLDDPIFHDGATWPPDLVRALASRKIVHNRDIPEIDQQWEFIEKPECGPTKRIDMKEYQISEDGFPAQLSPITAYQRNAIWVKFFDPWNVLSNDRRERDEYAQIAMKMTNLGSSGVVFNPRSRLLEGTASEIDALLPYTHGLGAVPSIVLETEFASGVFIEEAANSTYLRKSNTQLLAGGTTLTAGFGAAVLVKIRLSASILGTALPEATAATQGTLEANKVLFRTVSASSNIAANEHIRDTVGGLTHTLDPNPVDGQTAVFYDVNKNWNSSNSTLGRSGRNINGVASDFTLSTSTSNENRRVMVVFNTAQDNWEVYLG